MKAAFFVSIVKQADVAELAYAPALGAGSRKGVRVQVSPSAPEL